MARERFIRSFDNTELFVRVSGAGGQPVVLCDGLGCSGFIWRRLMPALEKRQTVVRWHYRGHGYSKRPSDPQALGIEELRQDLLAVLDAVGIDRAVLFGHSLGVQVILDFALEAPDRVEALVPVCGSYGRPIETFHDNGLLDMVFPTAREAIRRFPVAAQRLWSTLMASELAYQFAMRTGEVEARLLRRSEFKPYFDHLATMDLQVFIGMLDRAREHTVEERLGEITAPTLVIAGRRDSFTPVWLSRRMARLIQGAELLEIPGGTHVAPLEQPELVELRVTKFLAERAAPKRSGRRQPAGTPASKTSTSQGKRAAKSGRGAARRPTRRRTKG